MIHAHNGMNFHLSHNLTHDDNTKNTANYWVDSINFKEPSICCQLCGHFWDLKTVNLTIPDILLCKINMCDVDNKI